MGAHWFLVGFFLLSDGSAIAVNDKPISFTDEQTCKTHEGLMEVYTAKDPRVMDVISECRRVGK